MTAKEEALRRIQKEDEEYRAWLNGEIEEKPSWLEAPIGDPRIVEEYCQIAAERVLEGVKFKDDRIIEILPFAPFDCYIERSEAGVNSG